MFPRIIFSCLFFILCAVTTASISPIAQCVEGESLNEGAVILSRAGLSNSWLSTFLPVHVLTYHSD